MAYTIDQIKEQLNSLGLLNSYDQITTLSYNISYATYNTSGMDSVMDYLTSLNEKYYFLDAGNKITQQLVEDNEILQNILKKHIYLSKDLKNYYKFENGVLTTYSAVDLGVKDLTFRWYYSAYLGIKKTLGTTYSHFDGFKTIEELIPLIGDVFSPSTEAWDYFQDETDYLVDTEDYLVSPIPLTVEEFETLSQSLVNEINAFGSELGTATKDYVDSVIADLVLEHTNDFNILNTAISNINGKITNANNDLDGIKLALQNEILRAQNAETLNNDEILRIEAKETQNKIDLENALSSLSSAIVNEVTQRGSDKAAIEAEINYILNNVDGSQLDSLVKIKTAFENADSDIYTALNNLATEREIILNAYIEQYNTKITEIENNVSKNANDLATEIARATNKEAEIIASIIAMTNTRVEAEGLIALNIQDLTTQINNVDTFGYEEIERLENLEGQNKANQIALNAVYEAKINSLYTSLKNLVSNDLLQVFNNKFI